MNMLVQNMIIYKYFKKNISLITMMKMQIH